MTRRELASSSRADQPGEIAARSSLALIAARLCNSLRSAQAIPGTADGMQQRVVEPLVDLLPQAADVNVDHIGLWVEVVVPDVLEQHRSRHDMAGIAHQVFQ